MDILIEGIGGDTVNRRTLPPGSVSSRAGLLTSRANSSASTAMDASRSESGAGAALDGNPDSEGYDVSYCRGAGLLNMNVSRDAFSPTGSPGRSRRWDFGRPAGESRKVDACGAKISRLNRYIRRRASVLSGQPAGGVPRLSTASMARSSSSRDSCSGGGWVFWGFCPLLRDWVLLFHMKRSRELRSNTLHVFYNGFPTRCTC